MDEIDPRSSVRFGQTTAFVSGHFMRLALTRGLAFLQNDHWKTETLDIEPARALGRTIALATGRGGWDLLVEVGNVLAHLDFTRHHASMSVAVASRAEDAAEAKAAIAELRRLYPAAPANDTIPVLFWYRDQHIGATSASRSVAAPTWEDVAANYGARTRAQLGGLVDGFRPAASGQLLLWHGEPGTGKTYALRALGRAWQSWCSTEYITDPEKFFGDPSYMMDVVLGDHDDEHLPMTLVQPSPRWRLLVLEDTGELLTADAKLRQGQNLSRFLNIVDGMLGQGLRIILLVTTNEPVGSLHPAVARPGRCAALVEFTRLGRREAAGWLAARGADESLASSPATIAELYAAIGGSAPAPQRRVRIGFSA